MSAFSQHRKASVAWLAILAILGHTVPFAAGARPPADAGAHHSDFCSSHAGGPTDAGRGGSAPAKHDPATHDCTLCAPAMAQITASQRADIVAARPVPPLGGTTGAGIVARLAAALPPPPCGPPSLAS
jgi:hypothetical protein